MLEFEAVVVRYGPIVAVDMASLHVAADEFVVITGSNGSGKSSLAKAALGLVPIAGGRIVADGAVATSKSSWTNRRRSVAYVPQRTSVGAFPLPVGDLLHSGGDRQAALDAADRLGIGHLTDRAVSSLSGGQLQRAYLARAIGQIATGATMLIADEPTSALDFDGQEQVGILLAELGIARLVISHDASIVARADRVVEMAGGRLRDRAS